LIWLNKPHDYFIYPTKMAYELDFWKVLMPGAETEWRKEAGLPGEKQQLK
jgi:hypothetical protein